MTNPEEINQVGNLDIAIIGMSGRFPQARNLDTFWQNLRDGVESISSFSDQELEPIGIDPALLRDPNYVKAGAVLEDAELFDASFFDYSPRTAEIMDPQHRVFLECAWEALENAGYNSEIYEGLISVYGGASISSYFLLNLFAHSELVKVVGLDQIRHNNRTDNLTTRVAYKLNLKGSAITVQTGCSSSLVAAHLACQSLIDRECDLALAGGISITPPQKSGYLYQEGKISSPDGHCRAFDAKAQGTVKGNGVGIVVLKRLAEAIADRDYIHAVIKGSAVNNDGSLKVGYTAPSIEGQAKVIAEAIAIARIKPETVSYIEAHGTGTPLGDPIEIAALTKSFRAKTHKKNFCAIGSVKTNIGHLDTAAGVAGLIKTTLALKHRLIPPSLHFEQPNPKIDFASGPFYVNHQLSEWQTNGTPRRAGVSSFGIGGTNAHVILEEAPTVVASEPSRPLQLLLLSAKTSEALEAATANLIQYLQSTQEISLADVAYTLQVGRQGFTYRQMLVCQSREDALQALETLEPQRVFTNSTESLQSSIVFMFPGQGTQYVNMALELYQTEPIFTEQIDRCCELLKPHLGLDLRHVLFPSEEKKESATQQLQQTNLAQPALFVTEYALAKLWMVWGIYPEAMIGHSVGEYVAACLADVFSLEDALALVAARGQLMQQLPGGAMLAVLLSEQEVRPLLDDQLSLAAVNAPRRCVISGPKSAINDLQKRLTQQGVECRPLHTSHAFHSPMMEPIIEPFTQELEKVNFNQPKIPFLSNLTGTWVTAVEVTDPHYWIKHLRQTVRFSAGIAQLLQEPNRHLLEVGPGRTLSTLAKQQTQKHLVLYSIRHPYDQKSDLAFLLHTLGRLWLGGLQINWSDFYAHERRYRLPLPTYPFERKRYWIESPRQLESSRIEQLEPTRMDSEKSPAISLPFKKPDIADWFYFPSWKLTPLPAYQLSEKPALSGIIAFIDECGLGEELVKQVKLRGQDLITVRAGSNFIKLSESSYTINPRQRSDYDTLLSELIAQGKNPQKIVHLWSVTPLDDTNSKFEKVEKSQEKSFYSLLFLAQALGKQNFTNELEIFAVTNNMQEVVGEEALCPEKSTVLGPVKVIPKEYPNVSCRSIDITIANSLDWIDQKLIENLLSELTIHTSDQVVAYRGNHRWVQQFEPIQLNPTKGETPRLNEGGVYLITGGLGGIGLVLAEHLAKTVRAKLILIGRSAFPSRDEWSHWLITHEANDAVSNKIRKLQELEGVGAEVLVVSADVANPDQMEAAITNSLSKFGQLNGVIHAAGVPGSGVIQTKTREMAENILAPKVKGTLVLDSILKDVELDFFILCSARTGVLGGFGQVDYCSANAFLDAFAHHKTNQDGTFTVSVDWSAWQEVGMAARQRAKVPASLQTPLFKEVSYPLFDQYMVEGENQEIYISNLSVSKHWILDEHRIIGKATLPGTAYLEMARAAFGNHAQNGTIEIREVFFFTPLVVRDDEVKEVRTILNKRENYFEFSIISKSSSESEQWQEHAKGEIACIEFQPSKKHEIKEIEASCNEEEIITTTQKQKPQSGYIEAGPRWKNLRRGKLGTNQGLATLELPEVYTADVDSYLLHPALLDVAVSCLARKYKDGKVYLPYYYKRLTIKGPLPSKVYSHIRYIENDHSRKETLKFNITIMDDQGMELVEIEEFILSKVDFDKLPARQPRRQAKKAPPASERQNSYLTIASPGILDTLRFKPASRQKPGLGEVEIEVGATGLNFKEVLFALGLMTVSSDIDVRFGLECAGKIVTLGEDVEGFKVGDEVIAFGYSCFSQFITTSTKFIAPKPAHLSLEEAATIPISFATAYNALIKVGRLCRGESVLIHAAAGGVGMAAVQVAQWVGAKIFATAGKQEKREFLLSLGIEYVMDSRSLAFADEVMQLTDGRGVDVVLNSLGGEFIPKGLSTLAPYGRFLEIGVRDILNNSQLGLRPFQKGLSFCAAPLNREHPNFSGLWAEIVQHFKDENFSPLPHQVFPITSVVDAFKYMAATKHIGKIVVSLQDKEALNQLVAPEDSVNTHEKDRTAFPVSLHTSTSSTSSANSGLSRKTGTPTNQPKRDLFKAKNDLFKEELLPSEGIEVLTRILGSTLPQVLVSTYDVQIRDKQDNAFQSAISSGALGNADQFKPVRQRTELIDVGAVTRKEIEQTIADIWQNILGIEQVSIHDSFFELGGDSLLVAQAYSMLREKLNVDLSLSILFEYPTINSLAEYLSPNQVEQPTLSQVRARGERQNKFIEEQRKKMEKRRKENG